MTLPQPPNLFPGLPDIASADAFAAWLGISPQELSWFADLCSMNYRADGKPLHHYRYAIVTKRHGSFRLIEAPKPRLKAIQRQLLTQILDRLPPHDAAHGFVRGRSVQTFASPHVGQRVVLRLDLDNFFPRLSGSRIQAFYRTLRYRERVADLLAGLCTNRAPRSLWKGAETWEAAALYSRPHLPQGAPSSPAIANACAYRVDCRLTGLASVAGARYTRYADDLAFSGGADFERGVLRFAAHVAVILAEEGFAVNHHKTRVMRQGVRQQLAGLVTNVQLNPARDEFDRLKAIINNCVRHGPEGQNREGHSNFREHLAGRVGFMTMVNPSKAARLRQMFEKIDWEGLV